MNKLTSETVKTSNYYSRYSGLSYYYNKLDKKYQLHSRPWLKQNLSSDEITEYKIKKNDTYDSLALKFYGNPTYYWIICDYNRIIDPFEKLAVGDILYIPTLGKNLEFEAY